MACALLLTGLAVLTACTKGAPDSSDAAPATPLARGLDQPTNDARVVLLARAAMACPWTDKGIEESCAALGAWKKAAEVRAPTADTTLVTILDDPRDPVRLLAGVALAEVARPLHRDGARAKLLVEAARGERNDRVGRELGFAVGELDLAATKLEPEVRDLVASHPVSFVRLAIVSRTLKNNPSMFEPIFHLARTERDPSVRRAAIGALRLAPLERKEQVSNLWIDLTGDPDGDVADVASAGCVNSEELCGYRWDDVLTKMEARVAAFPSFMPFALGELYAQPRATAQQKARAKKLATAVLETKTNDDIARGKALGALATMDPVAARKLAVQYATDTSLVLLPMVARDLLSDAGARDGG